MAQASTRGLATPVGGAKVANPPSFVEYKDVRFLIIDCVRGAMLVARVCWHCATARGRLGARPVPRGLASVDARPATTAAAAALPPHTRFAQPTDANVEAYIQEFKKYNVKHLVRACESSYSTARVEAAGVRVHDLAFPDGSPPPDAVVTRWLELCDATFHGKKLKEPASAGSATPAADAPAPSPAAAAGAGAGAGAAPAAAVAAATAPSVAVHCVAGLGRAPVLVAIALVEAGLQPLEAVTAIREKRKGAINRKQLTYLETDYKKRKAGCVVM
jgi:protein tyrosine phosphatase type 4A